MTTSNSPTPKGSRRPVVVLETLMPHLHAERHHVYRDAVALALLAALVAAGVGSLPVALVLAAVALPAAVLVYIHDHRLWHDEPATVLVVTFGLSLLLGVGVGLLEVHLLQFVVLGSTSYHVPPASRIVGVGLLVPMMAFVAVMVAPLITSSRKAFRHPMDVVVAASLSGAAMSLGLSAVVQHGAFAHVQATAGDPAHVAFIALTLGFLQPIVLATAAMVGVLGLRRLGVNPIIGVGQGLALVVAYELATTLLQPYGTRGIVLTALAAFVLAGAGLAAARNAMQAAMGDDASADHHAAPGAVPHRLHGGAVAATIAGIVLVAVLICLVIVSRGPASRPSPGRSGLVPHARAAGAFPSTTGRSSQSDSGALRLGADTIMLAAGSAKAINLYNSVSITPAPGWTVADHGERWIALMNGDKTAAMFVAAGSADAPDINQQSAALINDTIQSNGLTNVQEKLLGPAQTLQGSNFTQMLQVSYVANAQTNQGTVEHTGVWVTLFNSSTRTSGFIDFFAPTLSANEAATPDADSMVGSML